MSEGWTAGSERRDHSGLIAHQVLNPAGAAPLPAPKRAVCRAVTYGGDLVELTGAVTTAAGPWLAFTADYPGWGLWTAWVARDTCTPILATCDRCADLGVTGIDDTPCPACGPASTRPR